MKKLMLSAILMTSLSASAVTISVTQQTCTLAGGTTGPLCLAADKAVNDFVNTDLPDVSIGEYGTGIANATGFAYKGLDSDYADNFDYFMVRGGGGVAVQGDMDKPESAEGFGIGAAATIGVNLDLLPVDKIGPVDLSKMDLFVSFMSYSIDQSFDESTAEGDLSHFAVMARYQIMDGKEFVPGSILEWGGLFLHTGFQRSSFEASMTTKFDDEVVDLGGGVNGTFGSSSAKFSIETTNTAIPVEISTYLRAAYVFTLFGGAGFDIVSGSTDVDLSAGGKITSGTDYEADIAASESDSGKADATNFRAFGGLQFNLPFFRVYFQMNKGLGNDLLGANLGAKILW